MSQANYIRDGRIVESAIARWGEFVDLSDGSVVRAIPNYINEVREQPSGEVFQYNGWELVFRPDTALDNGKVITWREQNWIINLVTQQNTKKRALISKVA